MCVCLSIYIYISLLFSLNESKNKIYKFEENLRCHRLKETK